MRGDAVSAPTSGKHVSGRTAAGDAVVDGIAVGRVDSNDGQLDNRQTATDGDGHLGGAPVAAVAAPEDVRRLEPVARATKSQATSNTKK